MSEPTPGAAPARDAGGTPAPPKAKGKTGPLPWWGWAGIVVAVVAGVIIWRKNSASGAATTAQSGATSPEAVVPVPTGTGLTGSQYAALASQNAAIYEAILDLQGDKSKPKDRDRDRDRDDDDKKKDRDRNDKSSGTSGPVEAGPGGVASGTGKGGGGDTGPPIRKKAPRGMHYLPDGRLVPNSVG